MAKLPKPILQCLLVLLAIALLRLYFEGEWYLLASLVSGLVMSWKDIRKLFREKESAKMKPTNTHTDCRSETGQTVGLVDAIITLSNVLTSRDLSSAECQEALKDLRSNENLMKLLGMEKTIKPTEEVGSAFNDFSPRCDNCANHLSDGWISKIGEDEKFCSQKCADEFYGLE